MRWYEALVIACIGWLMMGLFALGAKWYLESDTHKNGGKDGKQED